MKVIIEIPDQDVSFALKVLNSLTFVKKASPMTPVLFQLFDELQDAAEDVRKHKEGKIKLKTAQELLNEL